MDKTSQWLHVQLVDAIQRGDAVEVARAAIVLGSGAGMAFGMVIGQIDSRDVLYGEAIDALTAMIDKLPDNQCEPVVAAIRAGNLPVDAEARRAKLELAVAARRELAVARVRAAIAAASPQALAQARFYGNEVLGVALPSDGPARTALQAEAHARLASSIEAMSDDDAAPILALVRKFGVKIDVAARSDAIAAKRRAAAIAAIPREPIDDALEANFDEDSTASVYADWLQAKGHPRGEIIALQLRGADASAKIEEHADALLGPLAAHQICHDGTRRRALTWRRGFIDRALLSNDDNVETNLARVADILDLLLAHPSGRRLAALSLGINGFHDGTLDDVFAILVRRRPPLRELYVGDFQQDQCEISWYAAGDLSKLWSALKLRALRVHAGSFDLGELDLPELETASFETGGLSTANAASIAAARWPKLRSLDVWFGDPNYGDCTVADAAKIVRRLPPVARLGLMNCAFADELGPLLRDRPLDVLDLSMGTLSDDGVSALLDLKINRLDVSETYVSVEGVARLRASIPSVIADHMRVDPPEDRMVCVGE